MQNVLNLVSGNLKARKQGYTHLNREGAPSYAMTLKEQVVNVLTTGTLGDTFYASGQQLAEEATMVLLQARQECPEFLARALVYARTQGFMKTLPVLGLVVLSGGRGETRELFEAVFDQVVLIPDDLRAFVTLCRSGKIPGRSGFGGIAVDAVKRWLSQMSEYHTIKYGSARSEGVTLRDILRMSHAKPSSPAVAERFAWLVRGHEMLGSNSDLNPQIRAFESLKSADTEDAQLALIAEGGLPYEVVVPTLKKTTPRIWTELLHQAPYMNLLRNLVTFARHEVFKQEENVRYAVERLTNPTAVAHSKVLPFRFFDAWQAYQRSEAPDSRIADALRAALELSFVNMPSLGNRKVCIGTDVSGSMSGGAISSKSSTTCIDIAGIFTGALLRRVEDRVIALPFETRVIPDCGLSSRDDILVTAEKIKRLGGGGTAVGAPVEYLLNRKIAVDVFIGVTDSEDWAHGHGYECSESFYDLWLRYKQEVNPDAQAFLVTIMPYRDAVAPSDAKGVHLISGWSDRVLRYISLTLETGFGQLDAIEQMPLKVAGDPDRFDTDATEHAQEEGEDS